jgi:PBP1b-binding outer membrane lipoprotein LpoB
VAAPNEEIKNNKIYKRMKKYLTLLAGAMFLTACSNDAEDIAGNNGYQPSTDAIAFEFNGDEVENATRASGAIYNDVAPRQKTLASLPLTQAS